MGFPADDDMRIVAGQDSLCLLIVDDQFNGQVAMGGTYTFNCSYPPPCWGF